MNEVLAYKPWSLNEDHFQFLIKNGQSQNHNWTIHEVLKAAIVLSTYHGLCGLCHGMGINPDQDIMLQLVTLMGPEALELTIAKDSQSRIKSQSYYSACEADETASQNSRSYSMSQTDK